jgi:hypothetical protein
MKLSRTVPVSAGLVGTVLVGTVLALSLAAPALAAEHRLGVGIHYWQTRDDIFEDFDLDENGATLVASYQFVPQEFLRGLFRFDVDLEVYADGYGGSDETAFAPVGYITIGQKWYTSFGVGVVVSDGLEGSTSDPFFTGRLGWLIDFDSWLLDVNINYRTDAFEELGDASLDVMNLGVYGRFRL